MSEPVDELRASVERQDAVAARELEAIARLEAWLERRHSARRVLRVLLETLVGGIEKLGIALAPVVQAAVVAWVQREATRFFAERTAR